MRGWESHKNDIGRQETAGQENQECIHETQQRRRRYFQNRPWPIVVAGLTCVPDSFTSPDDAAATSWFVLLETDRCSKLNKAATLADEDDGTGVCLAAEGSGQAS